MARTQLAAGMEVTVLSHDGKPQSITKIERQRRDGGWITLSGRVNRPSESWWTKSGLQDGGQKGYRPRIVPTTAEHRRTLWERDTRYKLSNSDLWAKATSEQVEAAAKLLGLAGPPGG